MVIIDMPRIRLTRATCVLVLSAALTTVVFLYPTGIRAQLQQRHHDDTPSDPFSQDSHLQHRPHRGQWPWLAHLTTRWKDKEDVPIRYAPDGLVRGWDPLAKESSSEAKARGYVKLSERVRRVHPIFELIERGQKRWSDLLARQSKTLPQAVIEYKRRYGRLPPKGFEKWWKFARQNNIKIVDDYDQIDRDIAPYFALSPAKFRERVQDVAKIKHSYVIKLDPHGPSELSGDRAHGARPRLLFRLLEPIAHLMPTNITMHGSDHDLGGALLGDDQLQATRKHVAEGTYMTDEELKQFEQKVGRVEVKGTASACPPGSPAWEEALAFQAGQTIDAIKNETTFVHDPLANYDFCHNPSLLRQHGAFSFDFPRDTVLRPIFQWSKHLRNPELLATPLEAYENATSAAGQSHYTPWEEKTDNRVFWRGSSTGDSYSVQNDYRRTHWSQSHRPRLSLMAQAHKGTRNVWVKRGREWHSEQWGNGRLNKQYLDVGLSGKPHQCSEEDGTCGEMRDEIHFLERVRPEDAAKYKFALDVDGNGWSSRFHRLVMSGSVVIKATIYPEWISDWITPWVHYVPIQNDYSDLYNIMSFFTGPPDGRGGSSGSGGEDELARKIAEQARKFGEEHWRWEDMQGYMFRLLLEYARLQQDDRSAWSYGKAYD